MESLDELGTDGCDGLGVERLEGLGIDGCEGRGIDWLDGLGSEGLDGLDGLDGLGSDGLDGLDGLEGLGMDGLDGRDGLGIDGRDGLGSDGELDGEGMLGGRVGCGMLTGDEHAARATIATHAGSRPSTPATAGARDVRAPTSGMLWMVDLMAGSPLVSAS